MAATISDMYTGATDAPSNICSAGSAGRLEPDENQRDRAPRICFLGVATSVISVFTALTLIQMEMVILCAPRSVSFSRRHIISYVTTQIYKPLGVYKSMVTLGRQAWPDHFFLYVWPCEANP